MPNPYGVFVPPDNPPLERVLPTRPIPISQGIAMLRNMVQRQKRGTYLLRIFDDRENIEFSRLEGEMREIPLTMADCE